MNKHKISINEWKNSIYIFNTKNLNIILHEKSKLINIVLNSYFNLNKLQKKHNKINFYFKFNINLLKKILFSKQKILILLKKFYYLNSNKKKKNNTLKKYIIKKSFMDWKLKRLLNIKIFNKQKNTNTNRSLKRLFVGFPNIKHTNNYVLFLIFIFNKYKKLLNIKLKKLNILMYKKNNFDVKILEPNKYKHNNKIYIEEKFKSNSKNIKLDLYKLKPIILNLIKYKHKSFIIKKNFLANIYLYKFKFNYINLINLYNIIHKIYLKKVILNIVELKYVHLDNSILVDAITRKLKDRTKRVLKVLKQTLTLVKLPTIADFIFASKKEKKNYSLININAIYLHKNIISYLKNKHIMGISVEGAGRLTRRMTASRAIYKYRYKGNMKNYYNTKIYSNLINYYLNTDNQIIKGCDKLLRGCFNFNITFNQNNSYNKNGSFSVLSKQNTI